jgi:glycosyltransferase involved in cell wall biosynthesis
MMQVSVVIPVYKAASLLRQAVESALMQPQVAEVVLVEDGSPDDSLAVCQQLAKEDARVKVYQHPGGQNRGAAASRNLGIMKSTCDYVAFLDADDYYLPNRFAKTQQVFEAHPECDGVYGKLKIHVEAGTVLPSWAKKISESGDPFSMPPLPPEKVLEGFVTGKGHFSIISVCVRKSLFERSGLFDENLLHIGEDVALTIKMAAVGRLYGVHEPVAVYRWHSNNRSVTDRMQIQRMFELHSKMWETLWAWAQEQLENAPEQQRLILEGLIRFYGQPRRYYGFKRPYKGVLVARFLASKVRLLRFLIRSPFFATQPTFWRVFFFEMKPHPQYYS